MSDTPNPSSSHTPPPTVFDIRLNTLALLASFRWLAAGWRDLRRAPGIGLFYGGCFTLMGWLLLKVSSIHLPGRSRSAPVSCSSDPSCVLASTT